MTLGLPPFRVIERMAKDCRCCQCCQNPPCDGVMAGGLCDDAECIWSDEYGEDHREDEDDDSTR